jgi:hypothetical protein
MHNSISLSRWRDNASLMRAHKSSGIENAPSRYPCTCLGKEMMAAKEAWERSRLILFHNLCILVTSYEPDCNPAAALERRSVQLDRQRKARCALTRGKCPLQSAGPRRLFRDGLRPHSLATKTANTMPLITSQPPSAARPTITTPPIAIPRP